MPRPFLSASKIWTASSAPEFSSPASGSRPSCSLLQQRVTAATQPCGFLPESRPFQPHITLARSKGPRHDLGELKTKLSRPTSFTRFQAREFLLYESFLSSAGSRYEIRERFPLAGG